MFSKAYFVPQNQVIHRLLVKVTWMPTLSWGGEPVMLMKLCWPPWSPYLDLEAWKPDLSWNSLEVWGLSKLHTFLCHQAVILYANISSFYKEVTYAIRETKLIHVLKNIWRYHSCASQNLIVGLCKMLRFSATMQASW